MGAVSIRVTASDAEALEILRSPGVRHRLESEPDAIRSGTPYIVNERMLLILIDHTSDACEAHIAAPKRHWRHIHTDINEALKFIVNLGYNQVYTTVTDHLATTKNLICKHGFEKVGQIDSEGIYRWVSKQH